MNDVLKEHIKNGYFVKIERIDKIVGLKATFPQNMLYDNKNERFWKIYEVDKNKLTIYKNGEVLKRIKLPRYTHRSIIMCDLLSTCKRYGISTELLVIYEDEFPTDKKINLQKLIPIASTPKEIECASLLEMIISGAETKNFSKEKNLEMTEEVIKEIIDVGGL